MNFRDSTISVKESAGFVSLFIDRLAGSSGELTGALRSVNGTAMSGTHYSGPSGVVTLADGVDTAFVNFNIVNDLQVNGIDRQFRVELVSEGATNTATVTILDDDSEFEFTTAAMTVSEDISTFLVDIRRTGNLGETVHIGYFMAPLDAQPNQDYVPTTAAFEFGPGETNKTFTVQILDDQVVEDNESFSIRLSQPSGEAALGINSSLTVNISDDDQPSGFGLLGSVQNDGSFQIVLTNAVIGRSYVVESTTAVMPTPLAASWVPLATNLAAGVSVIFLDTNAVIHPKKVYRGREE